MQRHHQHHQRMPHNSQFRGSNTAGNNNMNSNLTFVHLHGDATSCMDSGGTSTTRTYIVNTDRPWEVANTGGGGGGGRFDKSGNDRICDFSNNKVIGETGNFQFQNYVKPFRHQMNCFRGGNFMQRNFIHLQGAQAQTRYVKIQGCKIRSQLAYGNYMKQKQARGRFNLPLPLKHFKNYNIRRTYDVNSDTIQIQQDVQQFLAQQRQVHQETMEAIKSEDHHNSPKNSSNSSAIPTPKNCENPGGFQEAKLLKPKSEFSQDSPTSSVSAHSNFSMSYDDITDNTNSNTDESEEVVPDLRERLLWKKHCDQYVKREPGEIYSDEDESPEDVKVKVEKKVKVTERLGKANNEVDKGKSRPTSTTTTDAPLTGGRRFEVQLNKVFGKEKKVDRHGALHVDDGVKRNKDRPHGAAIHKRSQYNSPYSCHDDRFQKSPSATTTDKKSRSSISRSPDVKKKPCCSSTYDSAASLGGTGCHEAEVVELRGRLEAMKKTLRDTRDKLLEARVVGSKKVRNLKMEVEQLKSKLDEATKRENDMKTALKSVENDLTMKRLELAKMSTLHDVEVREKEKFRSDLTTTYQDRLTIEIDKLRALFDIELAKMQAFYLPQSMCYEDGSGINLAKGVSDRDLRNHEQHEVGTGGSGMHQQNVESEGTSRINTPVPAPFMHRYFNFPTTPSTQISGFYQPGRIKLNSSVANGQRGIPSTNDANSDSPTNLDKAGF